MSGRTNRRGKQKVLTQNASSSIPNIIAVTKLYLSNLSNVDHKGILISSVEQGSETENKIPLKLEHFDNFGILQLNYKGPKFHDYFPLDATIKVSEILLKKSTSANNAFSLKYMKKDDLRNGSWDIIHIITKNESDCNYLFEKAVKNNYTIILAIQFEIINANNSSRKLTLYPRGVNSPLLHCTVAEKDIKIIETLLRCKLEINARNKAGQTPLHCAVDAGNENAVDILLKKGANYELEDNLYRAPFHLAARQKHLNIIEVFLKNNIDADILNSRRRTPLFYLSEKPIHFQHKAVYKKTYSKIIDVFLQKGANINSRDSEGNTPLHCAVINDNIELVQALLECNADVNIQNKSGRTVLHVACFFEANKYIQVHLNFNVNINDVDVKGKTALHMAIDKLNYGTVELILKKNPNINMRDKFGETALHLALELRCLPIVELLLKNKADVNIQDESGRTVLHVACLCGANKCIQVLLDFNVNINAVDVKGNTALHVAVKRENCDAVELILEKNPNINMIDESERPALHLAIESECLPIVELLLKKNANVNLKDEFGRTALHVASKCPHITIKIIKSILNSTSNINAKDKIGRTPVHYAGLNNNNCFLKYLLEENADVNAKDSEGKSLLHLTIDPKNSYFQCVKILVDHKVDINAVDNDLTSPLHLACFSKNAEVVKYLIENGADSSMRDKRGRTVFHYACMNRSNGMPWESFDTKELIEDTLNVLVEENISVNCVDRFGKTPLHYLAENNRLSHINELLLNIGADINIVDKDHNLAFDKFLESNHFSVYLTLKPYIQQIVKMKVLKLWVREGILDKIYKVDDERVLKCIRDYEDACNKEIDSMKSTNFDQSNITCYDFLKKSPHDAMNFTRNQNIVEAIQSDKLITMFPVYGYFLKNHLREAQRRSYLYDQIQESLKPYIFKRLPTPCMNEILRYLNNSELNVLLEAMRPVVLVYS